MNGFDVHLAPLLPPALLWGGGALGLSLCVYGLTRRAPGGWLRLGALMLLLAALAQPVLERQSLQPVKDIALLLVDDSASENLPPRAAQKEAALPALRRQLDALPDLEWREIHVKGRDATMLAAALAEAFSDIAPARRAGALIVSDGQIHDAATLAGLKDSNGPLHLLVTGRKNERDRRIELIGAPRYGLVGQSLTVKFRVRDEAEEGGQVAVTLRTPQGETQEVMVTSGAASSVELPVAHAGDNIFTLTAAAALDEITTSNNRVALKLQGVRERLRVLLVSGAPHPGERAWRNLLKSDPAVDLVHFTILRTPDKLDATPNEELSLIAFPVRELFEEKLDSFDLVVFDRFHNHGMLPAQYLANIARYVENGGAFLDAGGPPADSEDSLNDDAPDSIDAKLHAATASLQATPLARILPLEPQGAARSARFVPQLTADGKLHPVTAGLDAAAWGPWYRQSAAAALRGRVLMTGIGDLPLLALDRVGKGRVAQLTSDELWLWAHGHEGGGPQTELMRRIAHWLMQEPSLEEDLLRLDVKENGDGYRLHIARAGAEPASDSVTLTAPDGTARDLPLVAAAGGAAADADLPEAGAYEIRHGDKVQLIVASDAAAAERQDLRATEKVLRPAITASGGGTIWLQDMAEGPKLERSDTRHAGSDWLGLRRGHQTIVTGATAADLLPGWAWAALLLAALMVCWRREGK